MPSKARAKGKQAKPTDKARDMSPSDS